MLSKILKYVFFSVFLLVVSSSCDKVQDYDQIKEDQRSLQAGYDPNGFYSVFPIRAYNQYEMYLLEDGYPGKKTRAGIVPHPIYGTYLINDFIAKYKSTKDDRYLLGAQKLLKTAVERMSKTNNAWVFFYNPDWQIDDKSETYYSALTQARYLNVTSQLYSITKDDELKQLAKYFFNSLILPTKNGGVLLEHKDIGIVFEEYPGKIPTFVLNGWVTTIRAILKYYATMGDNDAKKVIIRSLSALEHFLPLYDIEELANSRYMLSGRTSLKFNFKESNINEIEFLKSVIKFPGIGQYNVTRTKENDWINQYDEGFYKENKTIKVINKVAYINVLLSYASYPDNNIFEAVIIANKAAQVKIEVASGRYNPLHAKVQRENWAILEDIKLHKGMNSIKIYIPWDKL